ncbi:hypothetical protein I302_107529 [Kwoniella bestiolae CBS 10118]|uniref:Ig-like domain-containing protein n=1 Tax=Kwoniella bestiolae CBS 10118 TaxID=1296100 RepID=A0A1B9FY94_9TREE|nr:hypothetical protein I302_06730 [Kwoniella bestiolae CBS 10118]OCF23746.1 hypothetical protein I302_06730 [Kwoniella bestiolae CBS 10118]
MWFIIWVSIFLSVSLDKVVAQCPTITQTDTDTTTVTETQAETSYTTTTITIPYCTETSTHSGTKTEISITDTYTTTTTTPVVTTLKTNALQIYDIDGTKTVYINCDITGIAKRIHDPIPQSTSTGKRKRKVTNAERLKLGLPLLKPHTRLPGWMQKKQNGGGPSCTTAYETSTSFDTVTTTQIPTVVITETECLLTLIEDTTVWETTGSTDTITHTETSVLPTTTTTSLVTFTTTHTNYIATVTYCL